VFSADLHVRTYGASAADEDNAAYAVLRHVPRGRVLELPVFLPEIHYGSVYQYYDMQISRERPLGYSTLAPAEADRLARRLRGLNCGRLREPRLIQELGIRYITVHRALYEHTPLVVRSCRAKAEVQLGALGFQRFTVGGQVELWTAQYAPGA
jgi:hypothetical protein